MDILLNLILPFFAIIFAGYLCRAKGLLLEGSTDGLNRFVYWIALPALLFQVMAKVDVTVLGNSDFLAAYVGGVLITMAVGWSIGRIIFNNRPAQAAMNSMNTAYGNVGFLGVPFAMAAFGETALVPTVITMVVNTAIIVALTSVVIEWSKKSTASRWKMLGQVGLSVCKNPMVVSPILGMLVAVIGLELPKPLDTFTSMVGAAASPCALFAVGMFLVGKPMRGNQTEIITACLLKLFFQPLVTLGLVVWLFPLSPMWLVVAVVMSAMPTGAGSFVMAKQYEIYEEQTSSVILLSTIGSVITLFLLLQHYLPQIGSP